VSPLKLGGGSLNQVGYTITINAKCGTMKMYNPTANVVTALNRGRSRPTFEAHSAMIPSLSSARSAVSTAVNLGKSMAPSDKEANMQGPVSKVLSVASKVAGSLAFIPPLSIVAEPVAWVLNAAAGLASAWGWAKPKEERVPMNMYTKKWPFLGNADGLNIAESAGAMVEGKVEVLPGFAGSDHDEMSFAYLLSRPAFFNTVNWGSGQTVGTNLIHFYVNPSVFQNSLVDAGNTVAIHTPLSALGSMFRLWRGNIVITLKLVKTKIYHTGRLLISFNPQLISIPSVSDAILGHTTIVDIASCSVIEFEVPFTCPALYAGGNSYAAGIGSFDVYVYTPLTASGDVANNIDILTYVHAKPGFEFAVPVGSPKWAPYVASTVSPPKPVVIKREIYSSEFDAHSDKCAPQKIKSTDPCKYITAGGSGDMPFALEPAKYCIGEIIVSLKSLLHMNYKVWDFGVIQANPFVIVLPFNVGAASTVGGVLHGVPLGGDMVAWLSSWYLLSRGSVNIGLINPVNNNTLLQGAVYGVSPIPGGAAITGTALPNAQQNWHYSDDKSGLFLNVPQYNPCPSRLVIWDDFNTHPPNTYTTSQAPLILGQSNNANMSSSYYMLRSAGDDFQLGCFLAIPPAIAVSGVPNS